MRNLTRHNRRYPVVKMLAVLPMLLVIAGRSANAQDDRGEFVTSVYNIADLLEPPMLLDGDPPSDGVQRIDGDANVGLGGGGFFRIPDNILPQFGGGEVGGGMGGMGGGMGGMGGLIGAGAVQRDRMTRTVLEDLLIDHLSGDAVHWESVHGDGGKLSIVGSMLVVTHTSEVHEKVTAFLDLLRKARNTSPTVDVNVRIVEVDSASASAIVDSSPEVLQKLADSENAARLSVRCENHRISSISSGLRRSYVVSVTPVVGSNGVESEKGIGYHPVTKSVLLGLFGKVKPEIGTDAKSGRIHLGIELASGPEQVMEATFGSGQSVDRMEVLSARLQAAIVAPVQRWTLAGTVAVTDPVSGLGSGQAVSHLAILVHWQPVE